MIAGATAMTVNVVGCYGLIQPRFGLPGYGVAGAGWASVVASWSGFAVILIAFARTKRDAARARRESPEPAGGPAAPLRLSELLPVLRFGIPNGPPCFSSSPRSPSSST